METKINDVISKYRNLKESSFFPFEIKDNDTDSIRQRKEAVRGDFERYQKEIQDYSNSKDLAERFKNNILKAIEILLDFVKKSETGSPLDRNQGLVIENFVFGKVAGVINDSLKNGFGVSYPDFYYQHGGDFDETALRSLLLDFQRDLNNEFSSYFELEVCVEEYLQKIKKLWINEDEKIS